MVPTKLPDVHTRSTMLLRLTILLLVASMILNATLWHNLLEQGKTIYKEVVALAPPLQLTAVPEEPETIVEKFNSAELNCLAENIYHESATESDLGKIAVAMVVLNRVNSPDFPNTICEVIHQPSRNSTNPKACQFSWTCDGKSDRIRDQEKFQSILSLSRDILNSQDTIVDIVDGALYYHAVYVKPAWAKYFVRVARIDTHIFYKNKS